MDNLKSTVEQEEWWRFQYAHRHFYSLLGSNKEISSEFELGLTRLIALFKDVKSKPTDSITKNPLGQQSFHEFCNCLVYLYRKQSHQDVFSNETCDVLIDKHGYSLSELDEDELSLIERLNDWTHRLGFLPTLFYSVPDSRISWDVYVNDGSEEDVNIEFLSFLAYPRVGKDDSGIKVLPFNAPGEVNFEWDMVINYNVGDPFYQIERKTKELWNEPGKQYIGERTLDSTRVYVNRRICKKASLALKKLKSIYEDSNYASKDTEVDSLGSRSIRMSRQGWNVEKDNYRRAVGLRLWDKMNIGDLEWDSRRSLIRSIIESLREESPKKLTHYFSKFDQPVDEHLNVLDEDKLKKREQIGNSRNVQYKTPKYGDTLEAQETVIREMEADYDLTEYCIRKVDYYRAHQAKQAGKIKS